VGEGKSTEKGLEMNVLETAWRKKNEGKKRRPER